MAYGSPDSVVVLDRTSEFRNITRDHLGGVACKREELPKTVFLNKALNIVSQCETLEITIQRHLASINSLDSLLSFRNDNANDDDDDSQSKTSTRLRNELAKLKSLITTLESQCSVSNLAYTIAFYDFVSEKHIKDHQLGIIGYLSNRMIKVAGEFQRAEILRVQRTQELRSMFCPQKIQPCPPLLPNLNTGLGPDPGYFQFLCSRWRSLYENPMIPSSKKKENKSITKLPFSPKAIINNNNVQSSWEEDELFLYEDSELLTETGNDVNHNENHSSVFSSKLNNRQVGDNLKDKTFYPLEDFSEMLPDDIGRQIQTEARRLLVQQEKEIAEEAPLRQVLQSFVAVKTIMDTFTHEVIQQAEVCDYIQTTAEEGVGNVEEAAKELQKRKSSTSYRFYTAIFYLGAAMFLLLCDFCTSRRWI